MFDYSEIVLTAAKILPFMACYYIGFCVAHRKYSRRIDAIVDALERYRNELCKPLQAAGQRISPELPVFVPRRSRPLRKRKTPKN